MANKDKTTQLKASNAFIPQYSFDEKALAAKQKKLQLILQKAILDNSATFYTAVKHKNILYEVGEYVELYDVSLQLPYVGKLLSIVKAPDAFEKLPFIQIQWCLKKNDLPKNLLELIGKHISLAEVFPANQKYCLYIESIKGKCAVLPLDDYSQMTTTPQNYYFSRAEFNTDTNELNPKISEWKRQCLCKMPINPDLVYIECGKCRKWFHDECVKVVNFDSTYVCAACQNKFKSNQGK